MPATITPLQKPKQASRNLTQEIELDLEEGQHLILILPERSDERVPFVEDEALRKWCAEQAGEQVPSLEEVRQTLSRIPDSMADVVISERGERF